MQTLGFEVFAMAVVIGNTIVLCMEQNDDSLAKQALMRQANYALTLLFMAELIMR